MKSITTLFAGALLFFSCAQDSTADHETVDKSDLSINDTLNDEYNIDFSLLRKQYISRYDSVVILDTIFNNRDSYTLRVFSRYYCLYDNALFIPQKYVWEGGSKGFVTHNYAHDIIVVNSGDTIFNRTITKSDFSDYLYPELKDYAVLKSPNFYYDELNKKISFQYSISIPITDIGSGFKLTIDDNGNPIIQ